MIDSWEEEGEFEACPRKARRTFGRLGRSRVPSPYPIFSVVKFSRGPKWRTSWARMAAPVGVVSSAETSICRSGIPLKISAVAGAGRGKEPWAHWIVPVPSTGTEAVTWGRPR